MRRSFHGGRGWICNGNSGKAYEGAEGVLVQFKYFRDDYSTIILESIFPIIIIKV